MQVFHSWIVRWKCHVCGKTFTITPDFALPNKRYVKDVIFQCAKEYTTNNAASYEKTAAKMCNGYCGVDKKGEPDPAAPPPCNSQTGNEFSLGGSMIYRCVAFVGEQKEVARKALQMITESDPTSTLFRSTYQIATQKYRTQARKTVLQNCLKILKIKQEFEHRFKCSLFPIFATACRDG